MAELQPVDIRIIELCAEKDYNIKELENKLRDEGISIAYVNLLVHLKNLETLSYISKERKKGVSGKEAIIKTKGQYSSVLKARKSLSGKVKDRLKRELISSVQWLDPRTEKKIREYIKDKKQISYDALKNQYPVIEGYSSLGLFLLAGGLDDKEVEIVFKKRKKAN